MSPAARSSDPRCSALHATLLPQAPDPVRAAERLRGDGCGWLLDSALPGGPLGRFSFAGADPYAVVRCFGARTLVENRREVGAFAGAPLSGDPATPLEALRALLPGAPPDEDVRGLPDDPLEVPPFAGGAVGFLGYELAQQLEDVSFYARDELALPDLAFLLVDRVYAFDHARDRGWALGVGFGSTPSAARARAGEAAAELVARLQGLPAHATIAGSEPGDATLAERRELLATALPGDLDAFFDARAYAEAVLRVKREIADGNVYQANLTQRLDLRRTLDPWALYGQLRALSPAPFAAYLELPEAAVLSSSPERFLRVGPSGRVESRPMKGTRPRGATPEEDALLGKELASSEKDQAENLMIVDLVRNDLGRVCATGSVEVTELMQVERYAGVFQMVSGVVGQLRDDADALDAVGASFPPGSMTGAPKIAAMRLIDRLEPVRRGVYSGALGYIDVRGGADLSVVIRTLILRGGCVHLHVGGGIVADSEPDAEYRECLDKARPLLAAIARAAGADAAGPRCGGGPG